MSVRQDPQTRCPGTRGRRGFLRAGLTGLWTLGLSDLLQLEAAATPLRRKSILVVWLWGGPSHMETFDMKPDAPAEYRGDFRPISTNVPGIQICEHLPKLAKLADRYALIRSLYHDRPGHVNSTHSVLTGYPGEVVETPPYHAKYPDVFAVANKMVGDWSRGLPPYVALGAMRYTSAAYLGGDLDPLVVAADPNAAGIAVPSLTVPASLQARLARRSSLLQRFDGTREWSQTSSDVNTLDHFQRRALSVLTTDTARNAFDLSAESAATRDLYGRHTVGQRCLLARRLVEAGARIVTVDFPCVPGQKAFSWDDHASVWNIFEQMKIRLPVLDQVVSALITDLHDRGLSDDVLLVVMGEMSRTPKLSHANGNVGREHWSRAMGALLAGGGLRMGQVVGQTTPYGEEPAERPLTPNDLLATWYAYLGIPLDTQFPDRSGRPIPILPHGEPIRELLG